MHAEPLPKIAMVTPLPPERTGIADYVAVLLPSLAQHFQVDLYASADPADTGRLQRDFVVRPWQALEAHRGEYAQVVYQFGNSPFHSHMVELLDRVPGIVVLHDFFLSSMFAHMDKHEGYKGMFKAELERSHGSEALEILMLHGPREASRRYPASRRIIERATAVIVHSEHAGELRVRFYPGMRPLAWHKVAMPQPPVAQLDEDDRRELRARLGVDESDFLVISLGFMADTKLNHVLLAAMADERLRADESLRLVFVGERDMRSYGKALDRRIAGLGIGDRVSITGFVEAGRYQEYLAAADCAVQLRTRSRGETSKAIHDCMSHALPTIVNNYAAFAELPGDCVRKVSAEVGAIELADALHDLRHDPLRRAVKGMLAKHHMTTHHLAYLVANQYAEIISGLLEPGHSSADSVEPVR